MKKVVFVISGGPIRDSGFFKEQQARYQPVSIICADGGARHAYTLGLVPDLIIGDMDSLDGEMQSHFVRQDAGGEDGELDEGGGGHWRGNLIMVRV